MEGLTGAPLSSPYLGELPHRIWLSDQLLQAFHSVWIRLTGLTPGHPPDRGGDSLVPGGALHPAPASLSRQSDQAGPHKLSCCSGPGTCPPTPAIFQRHPSWGPGQPCLVHSNPPWRDLDIVARPSWRSARVALGCVIGHFFFFLSLTGRSSLWIGTRYSSCSPSTAPTQARGPSLGRHWPHQGQKALRAKGGGVREGVG